MDRIRILIGGSPDTLSDVIIETIRHLPDFELVEDEVVAAHNIALFFRGAQKPDVLILFGNETDFDKAAIFAAHPSLVVSLIAIRRDLVRLDLKGVDQTQFLSTLRTLASADSHSREDKRLLIYEIAPGATMLPEGTCELLEVPPMARGVWSKAAAWIDAALMRHHLARPVSANEFAGFAVSPAAIEGALAQPKPPDPATEEANGAVDHAAAELIAALDAADPCFDPLAALAKNLKLSPLEFQALLLCMAPEIDHKYHAIFGFLNNDVSRRAATVGLVCSILGSPFLVRSALALSGNLIRWRLIAHDGAHLPFADEPLKLDQDVMSWLLGSASALVREPQLKFVVRHDPWPGSACMKGPVDLAMVQRLARWFTGASPENAWLCLTGKDIEGWRALVESAALEAPAQLIRISLEAFSGYDHPGLDEAAARIARAARLTRSIVVLDAVASDGGCVLPSILEPIFAAADGGRLRCVLIAPQIEQIIALVPRERTTLIERDQPDAAATGAVYAAAAAAEGLQLPHAHAERLAAAYPLNLARIGQAMRLSAASLAPDGRPVTPLMRHSSDACRRVAATELPRYARRVETTFRLKDMVLPSDRLEQLHELVAQVVNSSTVLERWDFGSQLPYGRGVTALFAGPPGTGKTMAGQAVASEIDLELYRVDLSQVVSKYIGETEKHLDAVFDDAERAGAALLFDEADALFGKRSEVKDAHDRYANIEIAYLLQRMEAFSGVALLTTNFRRNLDQAFLRRLRFVIEFPMPDAVAREAIWQQCLPDLAPVARDVDFRYLARKLEIAGGNIRQITLRAAFAAAREKAPDISMRHIVAATRAELLKLGMATAERELRENLSLVEKPAERAA